MFNRERDGDLFEDLLSDLGYHMESLLEQTALESSHAFDNPLTPVHEAKDASELESFLNFTEQERLTLSPIPMFAEERDEPSPGLQDLETVANQIQGVPRTPQKKKSDPKPQSSPPVLPETTQAKNVLEHARLRIHYLLTSYGAPPTPALEDLREKSNLEAYERLARDGRLRPYLARMFGTGDLVREYQQGRGQVEGRGIQFARLRWLKKFFLRRR